MDASRLEGTVSEVMEQAEKRYQFWGSPGKASKDVLRSLDTAALGERVLGNRGQRRPPKGYGPRFLELGLWMISSPWETRERWRFF